MLQCCSPICICVLPVIVAMAPIVVRIVVVVVLERNDPWWVPSSHCGSCECVGLCCMYVGDTSQVQFKSVYPEATKKRIYSLFFLLTWRHKTNRLPFAPVDRTEGKELPLKGSGRTQEMGMGMELNLASSSSSSSAKQKEHDRALGGREREWEWNGLDWNGKRIGYYSGPAMSTTSHQTQADQTKPNQMGGRR